MKQPQNSHPGIQTNLFEKQDAKFPQEHNKTTIRLMETGKVRCIRTHKNFPWIYRLVNNGNIKGDN